MGCPGDAAGRAMLAADELLGLVTAAGGEREREREQRRRREPPLPPPPAPSASSSPSPALLAVGDLQGNVTLLELPGLAPAACLQAHNKEVRALAYSGPPHHILASGSRDTVVHMYKIRPGEPSAPDVWSLPPLSAAVTSLAFAQVTPSPPAFLPFLPRSVATRGM